MCPLRFRRCGRCGTFSPNNETRCLSEVWVFANYGVVNIGGGEHGACGIGRRRWDNTRRLGFKSEHPSSQFMEVELTAAATNPASTLRVAVIERTRIVMVDVQRSECRSLGEILIPASHIYRIAARVIA